MGASRRTLVRHGLGMLAVIPLAVCLALVDLDFWPRVAVYATLGFYAGCTSVIDRHLGVTP